MLRFGGKQQLQVKPINFSLENTVILDSKTISITDYVSAWHHLLISLPASERMQAVEIWFDCVSLTEGVLILRKKNSTEQQAMKHMKIFFL